MLGKLLKYDFRSIARGLFPVYLLIIGLSVVLSVMIRLRMNESNPVSIIAVWLVALLVGSTIGTVVLLMKRFTVGLLGNEGYLYFALPVKTAEHIVSKLLNAVIWGVLQVTVTWLSVFLMAMIGNESGLKEFFEALGKWLPQIDARQWLMIGRIFLLMLLEIVATVCFVYLCCSIGHLFSSHRRLWSVLAGIAIISARERLTPSAGNLGMEENSSGWLIAFATPIVFSAIYLGFTWYILDRKLNLE